VNLAEGYDAADLLSGGREQLIARRAASGEGSTVKV